MKIKNITSEHRNDFCAIMECEHCGSTQKLSSGYHDKEKTEMALCRKPPTTTARSMWPNAEARENAAE